MKYRLLVLAVAAGVLVIGALQLKDTRPEALPEFGQVRVEVQTESLGLSAEEAEQLMTNPMENEFFNGLPWLEEIRSTSTPGLSAIELIFEPGTDLLRARQVVEERLTMVAALPNASSRPPFTNQAVSSTGRAMLIGLTSKDLSLIDVSLLARWKIKPRLMGVPGVANVSIWGQRERQLQVRVDPARLDRHRVSLDQIIHTTGNSLFVSPLTFVEASTPGTGGFIDTANQRIDVQHTQPIKTAKDLAKVTVVDAEGRGLRLGDVASVVEDHQPLIGDAVLRDAPNVLLVVERFPDTNVVEVTRAVEQALDSIRPALSGVEVDTTVFRPATFIDDAVANLTTTLIIGAVLLVLVLGAFLFDWRAALVSLASIALSLVTAAFLLSSLGAELNLVILAGLLLAVAVIVDDAIVDVQNYRRTLRERARQDDHPKPASIVQAGVAMRGSLFAATLIVLVSVVPLLVIGELSGAFLRPLAQSYGLAVLVSMLVALTVAPALASLVLSGDRGLRESPVARWLAGAYAAILARLVQRPAWVYASAGVAIVAALAFATTLGGRQLAPELRDRNVMINWDAAPGTSQPEMRRITSAASRELRAIPGVRNVGAHYGRALTSDEVLTVNSGAIWVTVDSAADYRRTIDRIEDAVAGYPGLRREVHTYGRERLDQVDTANDKPLVVRVFGNDYDVLRSKAQEVRRTLAQIDGVHRPQVRLPAQQPIVEVEARTADAAKHGILPGDIRRASATLMAGINAGSLFEDQKVFDVVVWATPQTRNSLASMRNLLLDKPDGGQVRLREVADVNIRPNPAVIVHDAVSRYVDVVADVRGRGAGAVTSDAKDALRPVTFPLEHHLEVLGASAERRGDNRELVFYVIAAAIAILFLLHAALGSSRLAALFVVTLPIALAGAVLAAVLVGDALSVVALMAMLAVLAVAVRGGLLLIKHLQELGSEEGAKLDAELVRRGAQERFVPTVMTALAVGLALTPLVVLGAVAGLELAHPIAVIMLGGLVTTVPFVLFVLPTLYLRFGSSGPQPSVATTRSTGSVNPDAPLSGVPASTS